MTAIAYRRIVFSVTSVALLFTWTVVLPWVGTCQALRSSIDFLDERRIDPAAHYYTDLDAMVEIEAHVAALKKAHPEVFWLPKSRRP